MRNLKRTLSMILALTMLLGMVTTGVGAAETTAAEAPATVTVGAFKDADQITYTEEVSIMAGMGLFAGTTDGKFDPLGTVTRAQMVTVLVKALRGNEFNANAFKGTDVNPFPDTASFEGGWAEGYITAGHQMGIVGGYGDGTFKPGKAVTTAEALTMIINALQVDAGQGEWPTTVMAKAEEMKLYGELKTKPATNDPMNREQLAVVTYEGMCYSPKGVSGYKVPGVDIVFTDIADAMKANGGVSGITEVVGEDALANQIYELKIAKGFVTDNQFAGHEQTTVCAVKADGTLDVGVDYFVQTDLDMIGHYVTVYYKEAYKNDKEPGRVYTIVDETTVVEVEKDITSSKDYKAAFGKSYQIKDTNKASLFNGEYTYTAPGSVPNSEDGVSYAAGNSAPKGTYFIVDGVIAGYMAPVAMYASYVVDISTYPGKEGILLAGATQNDSYIPNSEDDDQIVEYPGIAVDDFVVYTKAQGVYTLERVDTYVGTVSKTQNSADEGDIVTVNGVEFKPFKGRNLAGSKLSNNIAGLSYSDPYEFYITEDNRYIGFGTAGSANLDDIVYVLGTRMVTGKDDYGEQFTKQVARSVSMDGTEAAIVLYLKNAKGTFGSTQTLRPGYYMVQDAQDAQDSQAKKQGIQTLSAVPGDYDGKGGLFTVKNYYTGLNFSGGNYMTTTDGNKSWSKTSTKYIVVDGGVDTVNALDIQVLSDVKNLRIDEVWSLLVSRAPSGGDNYIEAVVVVGKSGEDVKEALPVYVSQEQIDQASRSADGYVYQAHAADGSGEVALTVARQSDIPAPGFYVARMDSDGLYRMTAATHNGTIGSGYVRQNQAIIKLDGSNLMAFNSGKTLEDNTGAAAAQIVDLRTETQQDADRVAEITSMEQLANMREANPGMIVVADLYLKDNVGSTDELKTVFIKSVTRESVGLKTLLYATEAPGEPGTDVEMIVVKSTAGDKMGDKIDVTYSSLGALVYSDNTANADGFYQFAVGEDGQPALIHLPARSAEAGQRGTMGQHNTVTSLDADARTLTSVDAHATPTGCGSACHNWDNTDANQAEALKDLIIPATTRIFDVDGTEKDFAWFAELCTTKVVTISYYCSSASAMGELPYDDTPELLFVNAVEEIDTTPVVELAHNDVIFAMNIPGGTKAKKVIYVFGEQAQIGETVHATYHKVHMDAPAENLWGAFYLYHTSFGLVAEGAVQSNGTTNNNVTGEVTHDVITGISGTIMTTENAPGHDSSTAADNVCACGCVTADGSTSKSVDVAGATVLDMRAEKTVYTGEINSVAALKEAAAQHAVMVNYFCSVDGKADVIMVVDVAIIVRYNVTIADGMENGTVSVDITSGAEGALVTVTPAPDSGYELDQIFVDGVAITGNTFRISATGNNAVSATFKRATPTIAVTADTVLFRVGKPAWSEDTFIYVDGANSELVGQTVKATYNGRHEPISPVPNYSEQGNFWSYFNGRILPESCLQSDGVTFNNELNDTMHDAVVSINDSNIMVTKDAAGHDSAAASSNSCKNGCANSSEVKTVDITNAVIIDLSGNGIDTIDKLKAAAAENNVIVNFLAKNGAADVLIVVDVAAIVRYSVTVANGIQNGSVEVNIAFGVEGALVTVTADPDSGYELDQIFVDGVAITGNTFPISATGNNEVSATFKRQTVTIAVEEDTVLFRVGAPAWSTDTFIYVSGSRSDLVGQTVKATYNGRHEGKPNYSQQGNFWSYFIGRILPESCLHSDGIAFNNELNDTMHDAVVSINDSNIMTTENAAGHNSTVASSNSCKNGCAHSSEVKSVDITEAVIVDLCDSGIDTLAELKTAVDEKTVIVNFIAKNGAADLVIITGVS